MVGWVRMKPPNRGPAEAYCVTIMARDTYELHANVGTPGLEATQYSLCT